MSKFGFNKLNPVMHSGYAHAVCVVGFEGDF